MQTLEQFRDHIKTVSDIKSVVATMKTLAAARIRQFETAANATEVYQRTVALSFQVLLQARDCPPNILNSAFSVSQPGVVLLGTGQGFCGRFNENIVKKAIEFRDHRCESSQPRWIAVGHRLVPLLRSSNLQTDFRFPIPASVGKLGTCVQEVLQAVEQWQRTDQVDSVFLIFSQRQKMSTPRIVQRQLLPLSSSLLRSCSTQPWESRSLPICAASWKESFSRVVQQQLYIQIYRCVAESLASENSSRIAAMQKAERNIDARLQELNLAFNRVRQQSITEELRDILAGFEAS